MNEEQTARARVENSRTRSKRLERDYVDNLIKGTNRSKETRDVANKEQTAPKTTRAFENQQQNAKRLESSD